MRIFSVLSPVQGYSGVIVPIVMGVLLSLPLEGLSLLLHLLHLTVAMLSLRFCHFSPPGMPPPLFKCFMLRCSSIYLRHKLRCFRFILCSDTFPL